MKPISTYRILSSHETATLQEAVNEAIRDGWVPLGAPFVAGVGMLSGQLLPYGGIAQAVTRPALPSDDMKAVVAILAPEHGSFAEKLPAPVQEIPDPKRSVINRRRCRTS
jgi:hypothetical protein